MIHLLDTELPDNKSVYIALKKIYGINSSCSKNICKKLGFSLNFKVYELTQEHKDKIVALLQRLNIVINYDLTKINKLNKIRFISIKSYRGLRKLKGLPVRGQRTRSNAKTAKKLNVRM